MRVPELSGSRRVVFALLFAAALAANTGNAMAQPANRIQLTQLEQMFTDMRAKTKWNVDGPLLWSYFFFDSNPMRLNQAAAELKAAGYRVAGIEPDRSGSLFRLHVEKLEAHTPASLYQRNTEFYAFAEKYSLASYGGMDVGPAPASPK